MNAQIQYTLIQPLTLGMTDTLDPEESQARLEALELTGRIAQFGLPHVAPPEPLPTGDSCHFTTPVRFGRRRSDQSGQLQLTSGCVNFRGAFDVSLSWSGIASVERNGRTLTFALADTQRQFRFVCASRADAGRGAVIAVHLAACARAADAGDDDELYATL